MHTVTNSREADCDVLNVKTNVIPGSPDVTISAYHVAVNAINQRPWVSFSGTAFSGGTSIGCGSKAAGEVTSAAGTLDRSFHYGPIGNREKSADSLTLPGSSDFTSNNLNLCATLETKCRMKDEWMFDYWGKRNEDPDTCVRPEYDVYDAKQTKSETPARGNDDCKSAEIPWDPEPTLQREMNERDLPSSEDAEAIRIFEGEFYRNLTGGGCF